MTPGVFLTLTATVALTALTPGPAVTAIVARAIADGVRPALALNAGVVTGDLLFLGLAAAGMAQAAKTMGEPFEVLRVLGAVYLAWQGVTLWRKRPRPAEFEDEATAPAMRESSREAGVRVAHESHFWRNYGAGLLLMLGHVQAILFYAALLPGFVDFARLGAADLLLVAVMIVVVIGGVNAGYALLASRARSFFADARKQSWLNRAAGSLMLAAAALVATR